MSLFLACFPWLLLYSVWQPGLTASMGWKKQKTEQAQMVGGVGRERGVGVGVGVGVPGIHSCGTPAAAAAHSVIPCDASPVHTGGWEGEEGGEGGRGGVNPFLWGSNSLPRHWQHVAVPNEAEDGKYINAHSSRLAHSAA